jgi:hypothetical protein
VRAVLAIALCAATAAAAQRPPRHPPPSGRPPTWGPPAARPPEPAPPDGADFDDDPEATRSAFWERAIDPSRDEIASLIEIARRQLETNPARLAEAEAILGRAVGLAPEHARAHAWLGLVRGRRGDHAGCADALGRALALEPTLSEPGTEWPAAWMARVELAICQARAGRVDAAERALLQLIEDGHEDVKLFERLADVQMALGRLDDARATLARARRAAPLAPGPDYALAVAWDRDGDPARARAHLTTALGRDPARATLGPMRPYAPLADEAYYQGLAATQVPGERLAALVWFRRYLATPGVAWAERAAAHVAALDGGVTGDELASTLDPSRDDAPVTRALAAAHPGFQACVAAVPTLLLRVVVTLKGAAGRDVQVTRADALGPDEPTGAAAQACVERAAASVAWPRKAAGRVVFNVAAR